MVLGKRVHARRQRSDVRSQKARDDRASHTRGQKRLRSVRPRFLLRLRENAKAYRGLLKRTLVVGWGGELLFFETGLKGVREDL